VTFMEIAALRHVSRQPDCKFPCRSAFVLGNG